MERSHSRGIDQAHVSDDRNKIETRKHGGGTTWDGTGSYSKYVKACSSPTSSCVSGACNCSGYPDKVLNYEKNACVPSIVNLPDINPSNAL